MSQPNRSLFVRDLIPGTRPDDLRELFSKYGFVTDVYIPRDYYTRQLRGFAYVEFERTRQAEKALKDWRHLKLFGHYIRVEYALGDRKTPNEMRIRSREHSKRRPRYEPYEGNSVRNKRRSPTWFPSSAQRSYSERRSQSQGTRSRSRSPY